MKKFNAIKFVFFIVIYANFLSNYAANNQDTNLQTLQKVIPLLEWQNQENAQQQESLRSPRNDVSSLPKVVGPWGNVIIPPTPNPCCAASGDVTGPSSAFLNAIALFAADNSGESLKSTPVVVSGKVIKNSSVFVDDLGNIEIQGITKDDNTVSWPSTVGAAGTFLGSDGSGNLVYAVPSGGGNVITALPFVNSNAIITTDIISSPENIKESLVTVDTSGNIDNVNTLNALVVNAPTLNGNATSATTAGSTTNFSGALTGDVTGTQNATVVSFVGGQTAANVAAATLAADNATNLNTPNTIVRRDGVGNFSAGTITAALIGAASQNILKTGDTMTGNLAMANQSEIRLQDAAGGEYVGLRGPTTVTSSYTVDLPSSSPISGQFLQALSPTALQWATIGGSPAVSKSYYVALNGSDSNDGSLTAPFRTISHAVNVANGVASLTNPIVISVGAGIFVEDNSGGPITITADGISLIGRSLSGTIIIPSTLSNNLFSCLTPNFEFMNCYLDAGAVGSTASGIIVATNAPGVGRFNGVQISRFATGLNLSSAAGVPIFLFDNTQLRGNTVCVAVSNVKAVIKDSNFLGPFASNTPSNTAISITGSTALIAVYSASFRLFNTAILTTGGANLRLNGCIIETAVNGVVASGASNTGVVGCNFNFNPAGAININASGSNTQLTVDGTHFNCADASGTPRGIALQSTDSASLLANASSIVGAELGIKCGTISDTSSTEMRATTIAIRDSVSHIEQEGSSTLRFVGGVFDSNLVTINDPTNVAFAAYDRISDNSLTLGKTVDAPQELYQVFNDQADFPSLTYQSDYYGHKGTVYTNANANPTFNATQSNVENGAYYVITGDRTKKTCINLISDNGTIGNSDNVRGWEITKAGTTADLEFNYSNNDTSGQAARGLNTIMNIDGFNNVVEFPEATNAPLPTNTVAVLEWAGDTTLYRDSANTLKTDGDLVVGNLTPAGVVHNDVNGLLSTSLIVNADISSSAGITDNKLATISTAGKVANSATTATSANTPSTIVTRDGSGNFAASTITANLIGNADTATTAGSSTNFTGSLAGDVTGTQGATVVSLVGGQTAANVAAGTALANAATNGNTANTIVRRDGSGDFAAGTITANLSGNATTATTAVSATSFTGSLVGDVTGTQGATVVSFVGGQTAANVATATVLANSATSANTPSTIVLRDGSGDFAAGTITANLSGNATTATTAGSTTSFTGSLAGDVTGTQGATVVSFVGGQTAANVAAGTALANAATGGNTANTIVRRDASGNFAAGTITANLSGNATTATTAVSATNFTGSLAGDVTGTQGVTVVSFVGGQTAANVAAGTALANAATSSNTANTIVRRDASGNFAAGTITANLTGDVTGDLMGNADTATTALTANSATSFTGSLVGDVTGTQGATVVSFVGGQSAANVASATIAANAATSNNMPNTIVSRDASGNFITNMITLSGMVLNPTDAATKNYVDTVAALGLDAKTPAVVVSTANVTLSGLPTIDGVLLTDGDRVLLTAQTNPIENGLWEAHAGAWTRPSDFSSGSTAGQAYVLILQGTVNEGSSWLCNTPTAIVDTDPISFALFSLPEQTTGMNVGTGAGQIFRDKTGTILNFKTIASDPYLIVTNNTNDVTLSVNATDANTPSTIVARDGSGNFSASTITANLTGNATTATTATTAGSATNFTGSLVGDVTGTQGATVVSTVGGQTAANVAAGTTLANAATSSNTASTIVRRDASGNFVAGTITANLTGNATTATTATNFTGSLVGDVTGTQGATVVSTVGGQTATNVAAGTALANAATSSNTASTIVRRDASGNFAAGTITASLTGNATTATTATTAGSATNFTGALVGDVTGTQGATVVNTVGGQTAANVAAGTTLANAATSSNTVNTIVRRDASGNFAAGTITANLSGNATTATTATNFTGSLVGDVTGTQGATVVSTVGGQTAANVAAGTTLANAATSSNTASTIVRRDASGNFAAGTITANLTGNVTGNLTGNATTATTATTATNFTGSLIGDVTGTQGATVVSTVGGQTAANVAAATVLANAATSSNTASTIVRRDASGNFAAGTITANLSGNATTATTATNFTGSLVGDVTGTQGATVVSTVGGQTATNVAAGTTLANAATSSNTVNTIVRRDASGNFVAGTITANLTGNVTGNLTGNATTATTATTATNFTGSLVGDVTGTQGATVVSSVGGQTAANVAAATVLANAATSSNTASTIVRRDASGNFAAGTITANLSGNATTATTATNFSGSLSGNVTGTQGATVVSTVGGQTAANVAAATVLANAATNANTASTIVRRDASGNFSAGTITANLSGNATSATTATNFTGSLVGDVTGTQGATVVNTVGGQTAANVAAGTALANAATSSNVGNTIARRSAFGTIAFTSVTASLIGNVIGNVTGNLTGNADTATTATDFTGSLAGDVTGTQGATVVSTVGGQTASDVAAATVLANTSTSANTASTIVRRDGSGNFAAGTIFANLTGNVTGAASSNVLKAGDTMTGTLQLPAGSGSAPSLVFTGSPQTGMSSPSAGALALSTLGLEALRITSFGNVTYKSNYKMYAYRSTNQVVNNTSATIIFDTELFDSNSDYNNSTGVYTAPVTGIYLISANVCVASGGTNGSETIEIMRNGVAIVGAGAQQRQTVSGALASLVTAPLVSLTAGDTISVRLTTVQNDTVQSAFTHLAIHFMSF